MEMEPFNNAGLPRFIRAQFLETTNYKMELEPFNNEITFGLPRFIPVSSSKRQITKWRWNLLTMLDCPVLPELLPRNNVLQNGDGTF